MSFVPTADVASQNAIFVPITILIEPLILRNGLGLRISQRHIIHELELHVVYLYCFHNTTSFCCGLRERKWNDKKSTANILRLLLLLLPLPMASLLPLFLLFFFILASSLVVNAKSNLTLTPINRDLYHSRYFLLPLSFQKSKFPLIRQIINGVNFWS